MLQFPEVSLRLRLGPRRQQRRRSRHKSRHTAAQIPLNQTAEAGQASITVKLDPSFQPTKPVRVCCTIELGAMRTDPPEPKADQDGANAVVERAGYAHGQTSPTTPDVRCPSCSQAMDCGLILGQCGCIVCDDCRSKQIPSHSYPNPGVSRPDTQRCQVHDVCGDQPAIGVRALSRTCTLCFGTDDIEWAVMRTCGHTFHEECLDAWIYEKERDQECPRCGQSGDSFVGFHMP